MVPKWPLDLVSHNFGVNVSPWGGVFEEKLALKSGFEAILDFMLICLSKYAPKNFLEMIYAIMWPNWFH